MYRLMRLAIAIIALVACSEQPTVEPDNQVLNVSWLNSEGKKADPAYAIQFPRDHASHPEFDIEWWYLTSNLTDEAGNHYALQWTLFRFKDGANASPWTNGHIFMGHASLHSAEKHWFSEKFAGAGLGNAGIEESPFRYYIDTWRLTSIDQYSLFPAQLDTTIVTPHGNADISLHLAADKPFVLQGDKGYSIKTADRSHASHYYSQPFLTVEGTLKIEGNIVNVAGNGWYDHEWSSQLSSDNTLGWDWFSLHLGDGTKLMLFRMRVGDENYVTGTYVQATGESMQLSSEQIELNVTCMSKSDERQFPSDWSIAIKDIEMDIEVIAIKNDAFNPGLFSYYEGPIRVTGSHTGIGFLELTGY